MDIVPVKHIIFASFHAQLGPTMEYSHPPLDPTIFRGISEFLIPKPEFCNRTIVVDTGIRVLGHPCMVQDDKYERNALIWNLCLVFESGQDTDPWIPIVEKLARVLRNLEVDKSIISQSKSWYTSLDDIYNDLNHFHECQVPVDGEMISLKIFRQYPTPPNVPLHAVPVLLGELETSSWDLTLQRIIPYINGVNTVKKIALIADVDVSLVQLALKHLIYFSAVKLIDIFQFSNVYALRPDVDRLLRDENLTSSCQDFSFIRDRHPYELYSRFRHGSTVKSLLPQLGSCDVRRLIIFGQIHNLLRRVHRHPIPRNPGQTIRGIHVWNKSFDALCVELNVSSKTLENMIESGEYGRYDILWK